MRRLLPATLILLLAAAAGYADARHQSYVTHDAGDSIIIQSDDRRVDAAVNVPVFPGDELKSARRGRTEVRLADGNVVAIDRNSAIKFRSIRDSYEGESERTIVVLRYGEAMLQRLASSRNSVRLDTDVASYVLARDSVISVVTEANGDDVVSVFEGSAEVRTEAGTERARAGEQLRIDEEGIYSSNVVVRDGTTDFERWFLRRADRNERRASRYLDERFSYADSDFDSYGNWVYVSDYGSYVWRPRVNVGWRPYYHGRWIYSSTGCLVWVSDEPWGWVPYHYGRWAYSGSYGWVWVPGYSYSPAWVYWVFGPSYVGWVPSGWYDCHRPYYDWLYRPYARTGIDIGFGFHGRVRLGDVDLRGWTFVNSNTLVSNRIDRAALTTDLVRDRLARDGDSATFSGAPVRFSREQLKDPAAAVGTIARGGFGGGTGKGSSGSLPDLTSFVRRDPELPTAVRERLSRPVAGGGDVARTIPSTRDSGSSGRGTVIDRGTSNDRGSSTDGRGGVIERGGGTPDTSRGGVVSRTPETTTPSRTRGGVVTRDGDWRSGGGTRDSERSDDRIERSPEKAPADKQPGWRSGDRDANEGSARVPRRDTGSSDDDAPVIRRERSEETPSVRREGRSGSDTPRRDWRQGGGDSGRTEGRDSNVDDTPRRVIGRIGGVTLTPSDRSVDRPSRRSDSGSTSTPKSEKVERSSPKSETKSSSSSREKSSDKPRSGNIKAD